MALMGRVDDWMDIEHGSGAEDLERTWRALVDGDVDPRRGHIIRLGSAREAGLARDRAARERAGRVSAAPTSPSSGACARPP